MEPTLVSFKRLFQIDLPVFKEANVEGALCHARVAVIVPERSVLATLNQTIFLSIVRPNSFNNHVTKR